MEIIYRYRYHWSDIVLMLATMPALILVSILMIKGILPLDPGEEAAPYVLMAISVVVVAVFFLVKPRYVLVDQSNLYVRCTLRTITIPLRDIVAIEHFDQIMAVKSSGVRMGGFQMNIGKYQTPRLGRLEMITTSRANRVLISTGYGYRVVINCPIDALRNHPHYTRLNTHA